MLTEKRPKKPKLPKPFLDKIKIDRGLDQFRRHKVLSFTHGRKLLNLQLTFRLRCIQLLKRNGANNAA